MPRTGIEPARLAAHAPETCASTYSATWAFLELRCAKVILFSESTTLFSKKNLLAEKFVLKQKQIDYGYGDVGVGQIEDGAEKVVVAVYQEAQQARHAIPLEQRKIEHVNHLAHHESGVMAPELRHGVGRRFGKDHSVEGAVEDVAHGSGEDQRETRDHPLGRILALAGEVVHQPADESDHHDPEDAQQQLAPVEAAARGDVHAEGRAVVFDEPQLEPVGHDHDRFVEVHVGLDPDFESLVCDEQQQDEQRYFLEIHNYVVFRAVWIVYAASVTER